MERRDLSQTAVSDSSEGQFHSLWKRSRNGSVRAITALMAQTESVVYRAIRRALARRLRTSTDSEDVAQSVWLTLLTECKQSFNSRSAFNRFAGRIAKNKSIDRGRIHFKQSNIRWSNCGFDLPPIVDKSPTPDEVLQMDELACQIEDACSRKVSPRCSDAGRRCSC